MSTSRRLEAKLRQIAQQDSVLFYSLCHYFMLDETVVGPKLLIGKHDSRGLFLRQ